MATTENKREIPQDVWCSDDGGTVAAMADGIWISLWRPDDDLPNEIWISLSLHFISGYVGKMECALQDFDIRDEIITHIKKQVASDPKMRNKKATVASFENYNYDAINAAILKLRDRLLSEK
jgi:hypothetical protein